jgi:pimeloyl-ACP methyl ester carboxylesterase
LEPLGGDGRETPDATVEAMARRYLKEMKTVQAAGPYLICGFSVGGLVAYEMACRLRAAGEEVALVVLIDTLNPTLFVAPPETIAHRLRRSVGEALRAFRYEAGRRVGRIAPYGIRFRYLQSTHDRAGYAYRPGKYDGMLTYVRALDPEGGYCSAYPDRGWAELALGGIENHDIVGGHFLIAEPFVGQLALCLEHAIHKAVNGATIPSALPCTSSCTSSPD